MNTKNSAAREIALALGVPPMLLAIPGDNTYSNYQEAQRAFWRQTQGDSIHHIGSASEQDSESPNNTGLCDGWNTLAGA